MAQTTADFSTDMPLHSVLTGDRKRQNHSRHLIPLHNLGDIFQNIGISLEEPQLPAATKEEKKGLKLGHMYLSCSQVRQQYEMSSSEVTKKKKSTGNN